MVKLFPLYNKGALPYAGGVLDQPNIFLEAMAVVSASNNEHEQALRTKAKPNG